MHLSQLASDDETYRKGLPVCCLFLRGLKRIFNETILWSENTHPKEEYASQLLALFIHKSFKLSIQIWLEFVDLIFVFLYSDSIQKKCFSFPAILLPDYFWLSVSGNIFYLLFIISLIADQYFYFIFCICLCFFTYTLLFAFCCLFVFDVFCFVVLFGFSSLVNYHLNRRNRRKVILFLQCKLPVLQNFKLLKLKINPFLLFLCIKHFVFMAPYVCFLL